MIKKIISEIILVIKIHLFALIFLLQTQIHQYTYV